MEIRPLKFFPLSLLDRSRSTLLVVGIIVFALLLRLLLSYTSLTKLPVTGDEASLALLAKMIWQGELPLLFIGQPYQFPTESYLMAPFTQWLPQTAFGARYQMLLLGLLSTPGFLLIALKAFPNKDRWPALLLILFPSAYLIILTSAYAPPQYSMAITLGWMSIYCALRGKDAARGLIFLGFSGLCCGLGFSNHLLTVSVTAGIFTIVIFSGSLKKSAQNSFCFLQLSLRLLLADYVADMPIAPALLH